MVKEYLGPIRNKYKAKANNWFDEGTIATLVDDYSDVMYDKTCPLCEKTIYECGLGLFRGYRNGHIMEKICSMCEFEEATV